MRDTGATSARWRPQSPPLDSHEHDFNTSSKPLKPRQALLGALLATLLFASAPACIRTVQLDAISLGIVRLALASAGMTAVLLTERKLTITELRSWSRQTWQVMLLVGLAFGCHWVLFFLSIKLGSAAVGAIGFSTYGLQLLVLGWLLGFSRVTGLDVLGLLTALVGTLFLVPEFNLQNQQTIGLAVGILSGTLAACLPLLHQRHVAVDVQLRTWGQFVIGLLVFLALWPYTKWEFRWSDTALILYLGLVAWIGHGLWIRVTTALSTTTISILTYLYLPVSLLIGYTALDERLSGRMLVGTALVLIANALVLWNQARNRTLKAGLPEPTQATAMPASSPASRR